MTLLRYLVATVALLIVWPAIANAVNIWRALWKPSLDKVYGVEPDLSSPNPEADLPGQDRL